MKFYAIVLVEKTPLEIPGVSKQYAKSVLWAPAASAIVFQSIEDAQVEIHLYSLAESYESVQIIELGVVVAGPKKEE